MQIWQYSDGALAFAIEKLTRQLEAHHNMTYAQYADACEQLEALYDERGLRTHDLYNVVRFEPYLEAKRKGLWVQTVGRTKRMCPEKKNVLLLGLMDQIESDIYIINLENDRENLTNQEMKDKYCEDMDKD